jgi:hypothetical protein
VGQPSQDAGQRRIVARSRNRGFEQANEPNIDIEELRARRCVQRQVHDGVFAFSKTGQVSGQRSGNAREPAGRHPQGVTRGVWKRTEDRCELPLGQTAEAKFAVEPEGHAGGGHDRGRRRQQAAGHQGEHFNGLTFSSIDIVDDDQTAMAGRELSRCNVKLEWRCIFQQSDGQAIRVTEVTQ